MIANVPRLRGVLVAAVLAAAYSSIAAGQTQAPPPKKNPLLKLIQPWPSAEVLAQRRVSSETLPLFASPEPFEFTLSSDFKALNKDRNPESTKRYPGELRVTNAAGAEVTHAGAAQRARPRAPHGAHVRLRAHPHRVPQDGRGRHRLRAPGSAEARRAVRQGSDFEQYLFKDTWPTGCPT